MNNPALLAIRATVFYLGFAILTIWFSVSGFLLMRLVPFHILGRYMVCWNHCIIAWLTLTCGVRYKVIGKENLPPAPYVVMAKHQSQWETFFLQGYLFPICFVLKRELLSVPFFGWGLRVLKSIAIDRSNPKQALRQTMEQSSERLNDGISVLIFPEGTRIEPGQTGNYARGGANIAINNQVPIVPIAHNAGNCWPADKFLKYPGTITVIIGKPLATDNQNSRALTEQVKTWIEQQVSQLTETSPYNSH